MARKADPRHVHDDEWTVIALSFPGGCAMADAAERHAAMESDFPTDPALIGS
ncbi:MAG: hypothetical protein ACRERE_00710 [Candidatus Entotheonellia bacterium]